jgi:hypothetical protein
MSNCLVCLPRKWRATARPVRSQASRVLAQIHTHAHGELRTLGLGHAPVLDADGLAGEVVGVAGHVTSRPQTVGGLQELPAGRE